MDNKTHWQRTDDILVKIKRELYDSLGSAQPFARRVLEAVRENTVKIVYTDTYGPKVAGGYFENEKL